MARRQGKLEAVEGGRGRYLIGHRLGIGGMGVVHAAVAAQLHRPVAVKFLHPERRGDPRARRRLRDEATAASLIDHPNVVGVLDHGTTAAGEPFFVMEHVHGEPLGAYIHREGPLPAGRAITIVRQILAGLACVHGAGIVHADLKSDNVLLGRAAGRDVAKLIDFGLARVQFSSADRERLPEIEEWLSGTPEYMAPEVIHGEGASFSADLYSVGVILYELLTGNTPFSGGTPADIVRRHVEDEVVPPSLRCLDGELPSALEDVVLRALAKQPQHRYHSAEAFDAALAEIQATVGHPRATITARTRIRRGIARDDAPTLAGPGPRRRHAEGTPPYLLAAHRAAR